MMCDVSDRRVPDPACPLITIRTAGKRAHRAGPHPAVAAAHPFEP